MMARKNIIRQSEFPYHITARSNNKQWFNIPLFKMWDLCFECLRIANERTSVHLHCFVLMGNHYHLILTTPGSNLDTFMYHFHRNLSVKMNKEAGICNHKFANGYKWSVIKDERYLKNSYRYVYQNPIRANLCNLCIDYPYSSLRFSPSQIRELGITVHYSYFRLREFFETLPGAEVDKVISLALQKKEFKLPEKTRRFIKQKLEE